MLVTVQPGVQQMLERSGYVAEVGPGRIVFSKGEALRTAYPLLDSAICRDCTARIFEECQQALPNGEPRQAGCGPAAA